MSVYLSGGCAGCGPCSGDIACVQARMDWHGNNGFVSAQAGCGTGCIYTGVKYLKMSVNVSSFNSSSGSKCDWNGSAWVTSSFTLDFTGAHNQATGTTDPIAGVVRVSPGCSVSAGTIVTTGDGEFPYDGAPTPVFIGPVTSGGCTANWVDVWAGLYPRCGILNPRSACGAENFGGGSLADLTAFFSPSTSGAVLSLMEISEKKTKFRVRWKFDAPNQVCPTGPPGMGDPTEVILSYHVDAGLDVEITLDTPYYFDSPDPDNPGLRQNCIALLGSYPLTLIERDLFDCSRVILLTRKSGGCCAGGVPACDYVPDPTLDGSAVVSRTNPLVEAWPPQAFETWIPDGGDAGTLVMQHYAERLNDFKAYGYQDGALPTRKFLFQTFTFDSCVPSASYSCENRHGTCAGFVMCCSPCVIHWSCGITIPSGAVAPIRSSIGDTTIWQGFFKPADLDRYPLCYPSPVNVPNVYVEPDCTCDCPDSAACGPPGPGECPVQPDGNYP